MATSEVMSGGSKACRGLLARIGQARRRWRRAATVMAGAVASLAALSSLGVILLAAAVLDGLAGTLWPSIALCAAIGLALGAALLAHLFGGTASPAVWAARRVPDEQAAERLRTAVELAEASMHHEQVQASVGAPALVDLTIRASGDDLRSVVDAVDRLASGNRRLVLSALLVAAAHLLVATWAPGVWASLASSPVTPEANAALVVGTLVDDVVLRVVPPDYARDALPIEEIRLAETTVLRGSQLVFRARPLVGYQAVRVELMAGGRGGATPGQPPKRPDITRQPDGWLSWQQVAGADLAYRYVARTADGRRVEERGQRRIGVRADRPPTANLIAPTGEVEVRAGDQLVVEGAAEDDLGLSSLVLVIGGPAGGGERRAIALQAGERRGELRESIEVDRLALRPGEFASVHIEAADNNALDGSRRSASGRLMLRMFSAQRHHATLLDHLAEVALEWTLRLADRLERDPASKKTTLGDALGTRELLADAEARSLAELARLRAQLADDVLARSGTAADLAEIERMLRDRLADEARAVQRIEEAAMEGPGGLHLHQLRRQHSRMIAAEEQAVLLMAGLAMAEHRGAMTRDGHELERAEKELDRAMEALANAPDDARRAEAERLLDRVQNQIEQMMQSAAKQLRIVPSEHVNPGAAGSRGLHRSMRTHRDALREIRARLRDGRFDDALEALRRLREQTGAMMKELNRHAERLRTGDEAALRRLVGRLRKGIDRASGGQRELRERVRPAAEEQARRSAEHQQRNLDSVLPRVLALLDDARDQVRPRRLVTPAMATSRSIARARSALSTAHSAVSDRQVDAALQALMEAEERLAAAHQALDSSPPSGDIEAELLGKDEIRLRTAADRIGRASMLLREALPAPRDLLESGQRRRLNDFGRRQDGLRRKLHKVRQRLAREGSGHPALQRQVGARLEHALQMMRQSAGSLQDSDASRSFEQMAETMDALQRASEMLRHPGAAPSLMPAAGGGIGLDGSSESVQLRSGNSSNRARNFRRQVLEAMQQRAPTAYRERLRRYYEEIVR